MSETSETMKITVWNYFERCQEDSYKAKCILCHKLLGCSTSANLRHHLKCVHFDEVDLALMKSKHKYQVLNNNGYTSTKELIHKSFSKVEGDKLAMCNTCHKIFSYRSTIANLRKHLITAHQDEYSALIERIKTEKSDNEEETYWEEVDDDVYNSDTSNKKKRKRKLRGYNNLDDGDNYTDVIYLEDEEHNQLKYEIKKPHSNKSTKQEINKKRTPSMMSSHEELNYFIEKKTDHDEMLKNSELDKFGQYVACLLESLPKHVSTKLQMNIINQIMEEKLKYESLDENLSNLANNPTEPDNSFQNLESKDHQDIST